MNHYLNSKRNHHRHQNRNLSLVLILITVLFWSPSLLAFQLTTLGPGLEFGQWQEKSLNAVVYVLRVDLKQNRITPIDSRDFNKKLMSVQEMAQQSGALSVINANFFDRSHHPLGLILKDGKILNGFHPTPWYAAFLTKGSRAQIRKAFAKDQIAGFENGVQAGPRLITGGDIPKLKNETSPKSAVGLDAQGRVYLIAVSGAVEISQFARYLAIPVQKGGLGLHHALNLDGGSSTQFYLGVDGRVVSLPGFTKVPVGLGVFPKGNKAQS